MSGGGKGKGGKGGSQQDMSQMNSQIAQMNAQQMKLRQELSGIQAQKQKQEQRAADQQAKQAMRDKDISKRRPGTPGGSILEGVKPAENTEFNVEGFKSLLGK